ncbi:MAG: hypothetical protein PUC65_12220 [Clostridiales bacterium]|nr:hypothetical protein [Clostridiales bacterium]
MLKIKHPKDQREYNRICKEWDSINEEENTGPKQRWKGVVGAVLAIGCLAGLFYALTKEREKVDNFIDDLNYPKMWGYEEAYAYDDDSDSYSYTMEPAQVESRIYDYDSTYNGLEMSGFVSTIHNLLEQNVEYINTYTSCDHTDEEKTLKQWKSMLNIYEQSLNDQVHHSSFEPAYQETMDYIEYSRELIANPKEMQGEKLTILNEKTTSIMDRICEAFDKNSIRYERKENGEIKFWYEKN